MSMFSNRFLPKNNNKIIRPKPISNTPVKIPYAISIANSKPIARSLTKPNRLLFKIDNIIPNKNIFILGLNISGDQLNVK